MTKLERVALEHFNNGPSEPPPYVGAMVMTRLLNRGWVVPHRGDQPMPRLYAVTVAGRDALASYTLRQI